MKNKKNFLVLLFILLLGLGIRLFGFNWDQNQHLHPDERFLTMVSSSIYLPQNFAGYFNPANSPLNPQNHGFDFFAYGIFPIFLVRFFAQIFHTTSYDQIVFVGRILVSLFDVLTILIIYHLGHLLKLKIKTIHLACFFYSLCIFPIQLSHFFTVDPFTVFFSTTSIYFFIRFFKTKNKIDLIISAVFFGITLSCKTSLVIIFPLFLLFLFFKNSHLKRFIYPLVFISLVFLTFRIFYPYAFVDILNFSPKFIQSINTAHQMITGQYQYPPNIQWLSTLPLIHPLLNIFFFGLGPFLSILFFIGLRKILKYHFIFLFILLIFFYQGLQLAKYLRYFYPIFPFLCLTAAIGFQTLNSKKNLSRFFLIGIIISTFAFLGIYTRYHSRLNASIWIYQNIPFNSHLSFEYWDDSLPFSLDQQYLSQNYQYIRLSPFDIETDQKLTNFNQDLNQVDYLILSSNRFWRPLSQNQSTYPNAANFYQNLFNSSSNFKLIQQFYSYPGFSLPFLKKCYLFGPSQFPGQKISFFQSDQCSNPGIYFRDDLAEESFTVYDHPQVLIFKKF